VAGATKHNNQVQILIINYELAKMIGLIAVDCRKPNFSRRHGTEIDPVVG
jgi:hypothetical protein